MNFASLISAVMKTFFVVISEIKVMLWFSFYYGMIVLQNSVLVIIILIVYVFYDTCGQCQKGLTYCQQESTLCTTW